MVYISHSQNILKKIPLILQVFIPIRFFPVALVLIGTPHVPWAGTEFSTFCAGLKWQLPICRKWLWGPHIRSSCLLSRLPCCCLSGLRVGSCKGWFPHICYLGPVCHWTPGYRKNTSNYHCSIYFSLSVEYKYVLGLCVTQGRQCSPMIRVHYQTSILVLDVCFLYIIPTKFAFLI